MKRLEHFFKGLSQVESQISAIPPDRYAERFIHFISGTTMSKELLERRQSVVGGTISNVTEMQHVPRSRPTSTIFSGTGPSVSKAENTLDKAEKQAKRSGDTDAETNIPERKLGTINTITEGASGRRSMDSTGSGMTPGSATAGRDGDQMLPVVEEVGEGSGSVGGESGRSSAGPEETSFQMTAEKKAKPENTNKTLPFHTHNQPTQNPLPITSPSRPPPTPPNDINSLPTIITTTATTDIPPLPTHRHALIDGDEDAHFPREIPTPPRYETDESPDYEGSGTLPAGVSVGDNKEMHGSETAAKGIYKGKKVKRGKSSGALATAEKVERTVEV
jgi:1-phosphatidylinositol-4-phosphate 5-kinase